MKSVRILRCLAACAALLAGCGQSPTGAADGGCAESAEQACGQQCGAGLCHRDDVCVAGQWTCFCSQCPGDMTTSDLPPGAGIHVGIPAYFSKADLWKLATAGAPTVNLIVFDPADGPGIEPDPAYVEPIAKARAAGITVIGYLTTDYARRSIGQVKPEIDRYYDFYKVSGIFFDEGPGNDTCEGLEQYYRALVAATRARDANAFVVLNPGTDTCESYSDFFDVLLTFESSAQDYAKYKPPAWLKNHHPDRFWHLVYGVKEADADATIRKVAANGVGRVYVTDDDLPNPWDTLPPWWAAELASAGGR